MAGFLTSASASLATGTKLITISGNVDCSFVVSGTAVYLNNILMEGASGTASDPSGNSTITLRNVYTGTSIVGGTLVAFNTIEGLRDAIQRARELSAQFQDGLGEITQTDTSLKTFLTVLDPTTTITFNDESTVEITPYQVLVNKVTAQSLAENIQWQLGKSVGNALDDLQGFTDALLAEAGIVPSGVPDKLGASQRVDALNSMFTRVFDTVADMKASTNVAKVGDRLVTKGYYAINDGGGTEYTVSSVVSVDNIGEFAIAGGLVALLDGTKEVSALAYGLRNDGVTDTQVEMNAFIYNTALQVIRFPAGVYVAYLNNVVNDRTIIFDEGAIVDGTIHIAVGTGPDTHPVGVITWVDNCRVIGTATSTVRVGCFYCTGLNVDKIRITEINPAYINQTIEGGTFGVHLYVGTKRCEVGEILLDSSTQGVYGLGVDVATTLDDDHKPEDIHIGRLVVKNSTQAILSTNGTKNLRIDEILADSWDTYNAISNTADEGLDIGRIVINGAPVAVVRDGLYCLNGISANYGYVEINGSTQIGVRTFNCGEVNFGHIKSSNNDLDQVRLESKGTVGTIEVSAGGTGSGVLVQGAADGLFINRITSDGGGGITNNADNVTIVSMESKNNKTIANGHGVDISSCANFTNMHLVTDNNAQGLRLNNVTDIALGMMDIKNNDFGIVGAAVNGLSFHAVRYDNNLNYDTNIELETVPNFRGKLSRSTVSADRGDSDVTLTVGVDATTQRFATTLTANRLITFTTTNAQNGDKFKISRTATGAFALSTTGTFDNVALAADAWAEYEFYSSGWYLTAKGSLA